MATFTIKLKDALDIEPDIGLGSYPIFDESYRPELNKKIIDHFWNQEIGQETIEMFKFALMRKMNEIMPLYNQHYEASQLKFDPFKTIEIKNISNSTGTATGSGRSEANSTGHSENASNSAAQSRAVSSDTPQTRLAGDEDYASASQDNVSETAANGTADDNQQSVTDDTSSTEQSGTVDSETTGYQGSYAQTLMQLRQSFVNVDMMVISELESLFMLLWSNGDEFSERQFPYYGYYRFPF